MSHNQPTTAPTNGTSREFDLLCACASVELSPERMAHIANWSQSAVDWSKFLGMAEHHGMLPLAARNLSAHTNLPPEIDQKLRSSFDTNVRRNLWFASELVRISQWFERKHLRAIPYKGPMLAEAAYGDVALRSFSDLDFLIAPADFQRALNALGEIGYRPSSEFSPAVERYWLRSGYERSFDSAAAKYLVELQWGLLPRFYAVDLRTEDLLARSRSASVGGRTVPALSAEDLLLVLCLHAAKHLWMRLIWVCDIAETIRTQTVDWPLLFERARALGILRILGVSFWLARELLEAVLPGPAETAVGGDPNLPALAEGFAARLGRSATYDFESTEYFRLILALRERRSDRVRYLLRLLWTPGERDLAAINLPETMFPLYRGVRALRLMRKLF